MSLFTDVLDTVKANPVAAAVCLGTGAVVVGGAWVVKSMFGGKPKAKTNKETTAAAAAAATQAEPAKAEAAAAAEQTAQ